MAYAEQIDIKPATGIDYRTRRWLKKLSNRCRRHYKIEEDEVVGKNYLRTTKGWMY